MDWTLAIERNREALLRVLATLFAMVGLERGGAVATLPRHLRLSVLRLLRPAESAVRRLLMVEARGLVVDPSRARSASDAKTRSRRPAAERKPSFPLAEPLPRTGPPKPRYVPGPGPRIFMFDGTDPVIETPPPPPTPDDAMDAGRLCRRLLALLSVLENLPHHARRLARWQAKATRSRPIRPGRPPGNRKRAVHEIDDLLSDCHQLALYATAAPDTS